MKALLIVDMLNDFVKSSVLRPDGPCYDCFDASALYYDGKLVVPGAEDIIGKIQSLRKCANENKIQVVYANDAHSENDPEFKHWPAHAIKGTLGARIIDELAAEKSEDDIVLEKQSLSVFSNKDADRILKQRGIDELVITGVATDYCVRAAALDAAKLGYKVNIVVDAIAGVDLQKGDCAKALIEMGNAKARPVYTHEILEGLLKRPVKQA